MSELEKMPSGAFYDCSDPEIQARFRASRLKVERFNKTSLYAKDYREALKELIPDAADTATVVPPFYCDLGYPIRLGDGVFINVNCTMLDCGGVTVGARTLIGANCQFYTPQHPMDYIERRRPVERALAITIGEDCWLGGGVVVRPGVKIGDRTIVGAGSVVVHDLPDDVMAAGNPAVVKRKLR